MFKQSMRNLLLAFLSFSSPTEAFNQKVVQANGLDFWTESFGNPQDPPILLIMGHARQGLMWHQAFCEKLASQGYFVIRYDHRDTGLSSSIDYKKKPYSFMDMGKDAIAILDSYQVPKAHIVAYSMGCPITVLIGSHYPQRVSTMTLISGSIDFRPCLDALDGKANKHKLSPSGPEYVKWVRSFATNMPENQKDLVDRIVQGDMVLNGSGIHFDEALHRQLAMQSVLRSKTTAGSMNHRSATEASFPLYRDAAQKVKTPTLIIQGDHDTIFPVDHGEYMKSQIPNSQLVIIPKMGHSLNEAFYEEVIDQIMKVTGK